MLFYYYCYFLCKISIFLSCLYLLVVALLSTVNFESFSWNQWFSSRSYAYVMWHTVCLFKLSYSVKLFSHYFHSHFNRGDRHLTSMTKWIPLKVRNNFLRLAADMNLSSLSNTIEYCANCMVHLLNSDLRALPPSKCSCWDGWEHDILQPGLGLASSLPTV